ncbi:TfoX/Sxy family protein [Roseicyclus sp.]|uniref:TfoX/Sxy family protein n=1 Tax=Roseicyclus sp. TaxID=1914329 RepID=UPI003F6B5F2F
MSLRAEQITAARDVFAGLGEISTRRMMGGLCLYHRGTIFAIVMRDGAIHLKAAGEIIAALAAAGATQWSYRRAGRAEPTRMPYWTLPAAAYDDPEIACDWARRALAQL